MSLSAAVIDALVASGATAEQLAAAMKASMAEDEARIERKKANNAERQRRFKANRKAEMALDNAGNALPSVINAETPAPSFPPNPPITPTPVSNNTRARSGTRLADDFEMPNDWIEWAKAERKWTDADARAEGANFVDFWHAKPGKDGRKADWPATWRNWVRNSRRTSAVTPFQRGGQPPGKTLADVIRERQAATG